MRCPKLKGSLATLLYLAYIVLILASPEIVARLIAKFSHHPWSSSVYGKISQGYPLHAQLMSDWSALRFEYRDYYLYSPAPATSRTVNFTSYYGARSAPASVDPARAKEVIWCFGGSTMQNLEADDDLTLANQIALELNRRQIPTRLHNFGVGAFQSSLELIKFQDLLRRVPSNERPTTVIFYDGFNEALFAYLYGAGRFQQDTAGKLRDLIERRHPRTAVYAASEWLAGHSVFWATYMRPRIEAKLYSGQAPDASAENLDLAVQIYVANVTMAKGTCREFELRCLFLLQPLIITKTPLNAVETNVLQSLDQTSVQFGKNFYREAAAVLRDEPAFHDLSGVLNDNPQADFFDYGHTSPFTGMTIGKEIAARIIKARSTPAAPRH